MQLNQLLATWYMKIGSVLSSCALFQKLGLIEEQVECLALANRHEEAKTLALATLEA